MTLRTPRMHARGTRPGRLRRSTRRSREALAVGGLLPLAILAGGYADDADE